MFGNINDVKSYVFQLLNKEQSGSIGGASFSLLINVAQQQYYRKLLGLPELYTVEKREAPIEIQTTQSINDSLRPFLKRQVIPKTGLGFTLPTNFAAYVDGSYLFVEQVNGVNVATKVPVEFVTITEKGYRLNNYIKYPTLEYPICTYENNILVVDPDAITSVSLPYYRYPVTPVWAFTVNANDQEIYDAANSVQLELPNLDWQNIANFAIKYASIFLREQELNQAAETMIRTGQ